MTTRPIKKLTLALVDGKDYQFLLSAGGAERCKEEMGAKTIQDLLGHDAIAAGIPILWEALLEKPAGLTREQFANELLPADLQMLGKAIIELLGLSLPEPKENPTSAAEATETAALVQ